MLNLNKSTKDWAGNWLKILGGQEVLQVEFQGGSSALFEVPYIIENIDRTFSVHALEISIEGRGSLVIPNFNSEVRSVTFLPFSKTKSTELDMPHATRTFSLVATASRRTPSPDEEILFAKLLSQIECSELEMGILQVPLPQATSSALVNRA